MSRQRPSSPTLATLAALSLLAVLPSCKEEDTRLFDETGVWSMTHYTSTDGEFLPAPLDTHENAFLLNFNSDKGVVAAASCAFQDGSDKPGSTTCRSGNNPDDREWSCRCYAYNFDTTEMNWTEFAPGGTVPAVGASDTDGATGSTTITVGEYVEVNNSYMFEPLPGASEINPDSGLFNSDGATSRFVFNARFESIFDETGCDVACFGE